MKNILKPYIIAACVGFLTIASCSKIASVTDVITKPSARQIYKREFKDNKELFADWENAFEKAKSDSIQISLPYGEKGTFNPQQNLVYSYVVELKEGESLNATIYKDSVSHKVFIDLFELRNGEYVHASSAAPEENSIIHSPSDGGTFKVIVQPQVGSNSDFFFSFNKEPQYGFPVAGKGNNSIQSFWQDERDGGRRVHEGIDVFAKRGTPVVAVTDGTVSFTGERGLGGKQVWQRAGLFGNAIYYAHLDSISVSGGTRLRKGDTLGFVGNTGNARTTAPHLHFGIYKAGGAVNPLPFVYEIPKISSKSYPRSFKKATVTVKSKKGNLRIAPDTDGRKVGEVIAGEQVVLLGENNGWLHVLTSTGCKGFVHKSLVKA